MALNSLGDYTMKSIISDKTGVEGGYSNRANDSGGETNHGITIGVATQYAAWLKKLFNWDGTMKNLPLEAAFWIYETEYWKKINGDELLKRHPLIADKLFDIAINAGASTGVKFLQRILSANNNQGKLYPDLVDDGGMGTLTLTGLDNFIKARGKEGVIRLIAMLICEQGHFYLDLVQRRQKDEEFYFGWCGRVTRDMGHYSKLLGIAV